MTGRVAGKVAFITGAARGQGRAHAVRMAQEGADIIAVDICRQVDTVPYPMATPEDLTQTAEEVESLGRRIVTREVDIRDGAAVQEAVDAGVAALGRLDIVCANAGIFSMAHEGWVTDQQWRDMIDINLSGQWFTAKAAIPHLVAGGAGGSIILTSSGAGLRAVEHVTHYVSAKHGLVGLMRALALELAPHRIRVNSIHPTSVATPMIHNEPTFQLLRPDLEHPTVDDVVEPHVLMNAIPVPWVEPEDIANAALFLASDEARYITGVTLPVDAGFNLK